MQNCRVPEFPVCAGDRLLIIHNSVYKSITYKEGREVPRKGSVPKREVLPDPVYGSVVVSKLINNIMLDGKKGVAQSIVYDALGRAARRWGSVRRIS